MVPPDRPQGAEHQHAVRSLEYILGYHTMFNARVIVIHS